MNAEFPLLEKDSVSTEKAWGMVGVVGWFVGSRGWSVGPCSAEMRDG